MRSTLLKRLSEGDGRDAVCGEDPGGDAVLNSGQRYEHVLWAHRAVARLCRRQLKRLLEPSGDAPAGAGRSVERARTERLFNAAGHLVKVDAERRQRVGVDDTAPGLEAGADESFDAAPDNV